jgi:hypothetical protein
MKTAYLSKIHKQKGTAAVEFALICLLFFTILFVIIEFGRMMYVYNTMQEVTRSGARAAVVRIPAGAEVTADDMTIEYLNQAGATASPLPDDPGDNLAACGDPGRVSACIYSVRVSITGVSYTPMVSLFSFLGVNLPTASVTMHAESLGFEI